MESEAAVTVELRPIRRAFRGGRQQLCVCGEWVPKIWKYCRGCGYKFDMKVRHVLINPERVKWMQRYQRGLPPETEAEKPCPACTHAAAKGSF